MSTDSDLGAWVLKVSISVLMGAQDGLLKRHISVKSHQLGSQKEEANSRDLRRRTEVGASDDKVWRARGGKIRRACCCGGAIV